MSFGRAELGALCELLRAAARTEIMPRFRQLSDAAVRFKSGPMDLVTDGDIAAEAMITHGLLARFGSCLVVGEEAASSDPGVLDRLADRGLVFVVDPIDGTANYAAGMPLFGCMAAALLDGEVVASVIHDPVLDESCLALKGQGAWMESASRGHAPMRVSPPVPYRQMIGTLSWRFLPEPRRSAVMRNAMELGGGWDFRCAAQHYRLIADGKYQFSLYNRLMPWDHAPGWLLHQEAGGYSAQFDGRPYSPQRRSGGLICTPDRESWEALRTRLLEI